MIAHSIAWTLWAGVALTIARLAWRDWRNPAEDRRVTTLMAVIAAVILGFAAVVIGVLA